MLSSVTEDATGQTDLLPCHCIKRISMFQLLFIFLPLSLLPDERRARHDARAQLFFSPLSLPFSSQTVCVSLVQEQTQQQWLIFRVAWFFSIKVKHKYFLLSCVLFSRVVDDEKNFTRVYTWSDRWQCNQKKEKKKQKQMKCDCFSVREREDSCNRRMVSIEIYIQCEAIKLFACVYSDHWLSRKVHLSSVPMKANLLAA